MTSENNESSNGSNSVNNEPQSAASLLGSNSALSTAFKDMKKRYVISQLRCNQFKNQTLSMGVQLEHTLSKVNIKDSKIKHLEDCFAKKKSAYESLEISHKLTLENEVNLMRRIDELDNLLEESMLKYDNLLKENKKLNLKLEKLTEKLTNILKKKQVVEEELLSLKSIPQIYVHDNVQQSNSDLKDAVQVDENNEDIDSLKKQISHLSSEKQTLKTNIHWLTLELEKEKEKNTKVVKSRRVRNLSETLEEACGIPSTDEIINDEAEKPTTVLQCAHYLQDVLKDFHTLLQNKKTENIKVTEDSPKLSNSFVNIDNCPLFYIGSKDCLQRDSACTISVKSDECSEKCFDDSEMEALMFEFSVDDLPKLDEPYLTEENSIKGDLSKSFSNDLPYSLFHQVHLLQTQTYLKSKTVSESKLSTPK